MIYKNISPFCSFFLILPLLLSAFTHLWNPIGFPYFHGDEGHYMRRAMHVLEGHGPQEQRNTTWSLEHPYDHPYFGQLFLAGALGMISYPDSLNSRIGDVHSIEMLHLIPRILMGALAVVDTFLIFKVAERRYNNRNVAFIAAILFAVMPMSWLVRRILLDSLFLPFLLLSILFTMDTKNRNTKSSDNPNYILDSKDYSDNKMSLLTMLSGIFLGLAIFTKIPAFTMLPLVGLLIYDNVNGSRRRKLKNLGLWFVPVILIPLIWPTYAISAGELENWLNGLSWQAAELADRPIWNSLSNISKFDPVLFALGMSAILYSALIKRDRLIILWVVPFIVFFYFVDHLRDIHWIPIIPVFCIAVAVLIVDMSNKISTKRLRQIILFSTISAIGIFGLVTTATLVTLNLNSTFFEIYAFIVAYLPSQDEAIGNDIEDRTIMMGHNWMQIYSWIPKYIFDKDHDFKTFKRFFGSVKEPNLPIKEGEKVLLLVDGNDLEDFILSESTKKNFKQKELYNKTKLVTEFKGKDILHGRDGYPYRTVGENPGIAKGIEVRSNY
jgi:hypothetical protein